MKKTIHVQPIFTGIDNDGDCIELSAETIQSMGEAKIAIEVARMESIIEECNRDLDWLYDSNCSVIDGSMEWSSRVRHAQNSIDSAILTIRLLKNPDQIVGCHVEREAYGSCFYCDAETGREITCLVLDDGTIVQVNSEYYETCECKQP